jgi:UDP-N-acetylmuramate--alanine ligase
MNTSELKPYKHVFFIGIGGISMSGLAEVLNKDGKKVAGSDQNSSSITAHLQSLGIDIYEGHHADHITKDYDLVIYTAAIKDDNVEFIKAKELGLKMMDRATLLGHIMDGYKTSIGVAGTHGKTTTTSMLSHVMLEGNLDPTISVGGILKGIQGNFRVGTSDYFITEACEYSNSFYKFFPNISIILNIEEDHMDFFKDLDDIKQSFKHYIRNTKEDGLIIMNDTITDIASYTKDLPCRVVTVGKNPKSTYAYQNESFDDFGLSTFDLYVHQQFIQSIHLNVTGYHNIENSLAAIAAGEFMGLSIDTIQEGLLAFRGADRRFEYKGRINDFTIIDDYAHHPTEILKTLEAVSKIKHNDLWVIFQPHTYTRTKAFFNEFVDALKDIDHLIMMDIYAAREKDPGDINSNMIVESLSKLGTDIVYIDDFEKIKEHVLKNLKPNDMLITMGAGSVSLIGDMILDK